MDKSSPCPIGFTVNEQLLCILEHNVDRRATEDVNFALRPIPAGTLTFQKKVYMTNDLLQMVKFVDDLVALMSGIQKASPQPIMKELVLSFPRLVPVKPPTADPESLQEILEKLQVLQCRQCRSVAEWLCPSLEFETTVRKMCLDYLMETCLCKH